MYKTILQVPIDKKLKDIAEKEATRQGFSSLQEIVRVFLTQLASSKVEVVLEKSVKLSTKNEERYGKYSQDFESGKNIYPAKDMGDLIARLNEN